MYFIWINYQGDLWGSFLCKASTSFLFNADRFMCPNLSDFQAILAKFKLAAAAVSLPSMWRY